MCVCVWGGGGGGNRRGSRGGQGGLAPPPPQKIAPPNSQARIQGGQEGLAPPLTKSWIRLWVSWVVSLGGGKAPFAPPPPSTPLMFTNRWGGCRFRSNKLYSCNGRRVVWFGKHVIIKSRVLRPVNQRAPYSLGRHLVISIAV